MNKSESIKNIVPALLAAQTLMGAAKKGSSNPYFKSKYADLGAVLEACKELLNAQGVVILQPHSTLETPTGEIVSAVETVLVHTSGEYVSSSTPIVVSKQNDPQALGSAISYARRYGLQSLLSMPAEDDDGESAMGRKDKLEKATRYESPVKELKTVSKPDTTTITNPEATTVKTFEQIKKEQLADAQAPAASQANAAQTLRAETKTLPSFRRGNTTSKANGSASKGGW